MQPSSFTQVFPPGHRVFTEGDHGDFACIIQEGLVSVQVEREGQVLELAQLGPGELFGEMAVIDDEKRSATVVTLEKTSIFMIRRAQFVDRMAQSHPMIKLFLQVLLARLRSSTKGDVKQDAPRLEGGPKPEIMASREKVLKDLETEHRLYRALERDEFRLFYQPIIGMSDSRIRGFEALIRWQDPERGLIPPFSFIGLAERTGVIVPMGAWALEEAVRCLGRFEKETDVPKGELFMSVNVSGRQLCSEEFIHTVARALKEAAIEPAQIKLEVTESSVLENPELSRHLLSEVEKLGVRIAIDDFGTGYSSLSYLTQFPFHTLKIDRAFLKDMLDHLNSRNVVHTIAQLAHNLQMDVVAEGIETPQQRDVLRELGCEFGQGYLWSKPVPELEADALLRKG